MRAYPQPIESTILQASSPADIDAPAQPAAPAEPVAPFPAEPADGEDTAGAHVLTAREQRQKVCNLLFASSTTQFCKVRAACVVAGSNLDLQ